MDKVKKTLADLDILLSYLRASEMSHHKTLKEKHGWDDEYFDALHKQLLQDELIKHSIKSQLQYFVSVKGMIFEGYVKKKNNETISFIVNIVNLGVVFIASIVGIIYAICEIVK